MINKDMNNIDNGILNLFSTCSVNFTNKYEINIRKIKLKVLYLYFFEINKYNLNNINQHKLNIIPFDVIKNSILIFIYNNL